MSKIVDDLINNKNRMYAFQTIRGGYEEVKENVINSIKAGGEGEKKKQSLEMQRKRG